MLSKKFQLIKTEVEAKNTNLARKMLDELVSDDLSPASKDLWQALYQRLPTNEGLDQHPVNKVFNVSTLAELDSQEIKPGISIVTCCMNRNENLLKALKTWVKLPVNEIIIVDWSSNEPVSESIKEVKDSRIKILRVEGETKWVLTYGFNVGLRFASYSKILKFDADIEITSNFVTENNFSEGSFIRGNWKFAVDKGEDEQKFVNGSFGATKKALQEIGYYNEVITTYGWDDSDIYKRLSCIAGCKTQFINPNTIIHLAQEQEARLKYQSVNKNLFLGHFEPTEYHNLLNKYMTSLFDVWEPKLLQDYSIKHLENNNWVLNRLTKSIAVPVHITKDAERYATLQMATWVSPALWRMLATNQMYIEKLLDLFKLCADREEVLSYIDEISSKVQEPKWSNQSILNHLKISSQANKVIECEGLNQILEVKYFSSNYMLKPFTSYPYLDMHNNNEVASDGRRRRIFVTSLYDEKLQNRLEEYLYCIEENIKVFDLLVLYYENNDGSLYNEIKKRFENSDYWQKIFFVVYQDRPTFEFLFDTTDLLFPNEIICVANADIAADSSIKKVNEYLHNNAFWAISRHEVAPKTKKPEGLIMNQLGIPNTFSADMWIYQSPRKYKFKASFPIGSFYCDSFINYYVGRSPYKLQNPCLDINLYHIHDPVFNSSEEKAVRDKKIIDRKLQEEIELNNGTVPLKGSKWCKLESCGKDSKYNGTVDWYNTLAKIHVNNAGTNLFQVFCAVLLCKEAFDIVNCSKSIWIILPESQLNTETYLKVESFIQASGLENVYIGIEAETRIEFNDQVYKKSSIEVDDLNATLSLIRKREPGQFFHFSHNTYIKGDFFGLDSDIAYVLNYCPNVDDVSSYKLLKLLSTFQLGVLSNVIDNIGLSQDFLPFITDINYLVTENESESQFPEPKQTPKVSFITSIYKGEEFMQGYLENIAVAAHECNGEVIIVDANSPQNEQAIFNAFIKEHPDYEPYFTYYRLEEDPGLYNCWQYAIERTKAQYVSNANLDDRRSPFQAKALLNKLLATPNRRGAAAAIRATTARNTSWYTTTNNQYWFTNGYKENIEFSSLYLTDDNGHVKSQNIMHCMPIWDKTLHAKYGYFDEEKYGTSADWAFWLECTRQGELFLLVPQVLSQYFINEQSHNRVNDPNGIKENKIVADYMGIQQNIFVQQ